MHKKNITLIFFLFLVGMPLFFSVYTLIEKIIIEYGMEERLEEANLQTVTIDAASIIWLKENKEILINGEPFDVKKITRHGTSITVQGLYDLEEKELKDQLQVYHHSENKSASANNSLLLLIFTTFYQANEPINFHTPFFSKTKQTWQKPKDNICSLYYEIITPPPRFI